MDGNEVRELCLIQLGAEVIVVTSISPSPSFITFMGRGYS